MTTLPIELANAREASTEAWNEYQVVINREHTNDEFSKALEKATDATFYASRWYNRWQAVGGTSDIESIEAAERFLNLVEVALTHAETIAVVPAWQIEAEAQAKEDAADYAMRNDLYNMGMGA